VAGGRETYGIDEYLTKPFDFAELGALLRKHAGS
jgi:DNA-binding response OmpR family regulator